MVVYLVYAGVGSMMPFRCFYEPLRPPKAATPPPRSLGGFWIALPADVALEQLAVALQYSPDAALQEQREADRLVLEAAFYTTAVQRDVEVPTLEIVALEAAGQRDVEAPTPEIEALEPAVQRDVEAHTLEIEAFEAAVQRDVEAPTPSIEWHRLGTTYEIQQEDGYPTALQLIPHSEISQLITHAVGSDVEVTAGGMAKIRERLASYARDLLCSAVVHALGRVASDVALPENGAARPAIVCPRDVLAACDEIAWALDARPRGAPADSGALPSAPSPLAVDAGEGVLILRRSHADLARVESALALLGLLGEPLRYASPLRAGIAPSALAASTTLARGLEELALVKSASKLIGDDDGDDGPWRRWRGFESVERCREAARLLFPLTHVPSRLWYRILASGYLDFADECAIAFAARNAAAESMRGTTTARRRMQARSPLGLWRLQGAAGAVRKPGIKAKPGRKRSAKPSRTTTTTTYSE